MREILLEVDQSLELENGNGLKSNPDAVIVTGVDSPSSQSQIDAPSERQPDAKTRPKLRRSETFEERQKRESDERWTLRHGNILHRFRYFPDMTDLTQHFSETWVVSGYETTVKAEMAATSTFTSSQQNTSISWSVSGIFLSLP